MFEIAFNKKLPQFYSHLKYGDKLLLKSDNDTTINSLKTVCNVFDVPTHIKTSKKTLKNTIGTTTVKQHKGYCIDLKEYCTIESYLKDQFSRSSRQALRSGKKRLETCFNISYKMYFGNIDKKEYDKLFGQFYEMLKLRAVEKGIDNRNLEDWKLYTKNIYGMILKKEASIFVIYDGTKPINISLNLHINDFVFLFITTYDIDYSKFRIGHTNWVWLIDWFIKNNIKLIDFSKGNTAYKKRWANKEYDFEYQLFYDSTKILAKLKAYFLEKKLQLLQLLRNKNINDYYYKSKEKLSLTKNYQHIKKHEFIKLNKLPKKEGLSKIFIQNDNQFEFLKPIVYQYLYLLSTNIKDIDIHQSTKNNNLFYIKSKSEIIKILIPN